MQFSGTVTDATTHLPLYPAAVALMGPSGIITGVYTNPDGSFDFTVQNADSVLSVQFSYVGYQTQTISKQAGPYVVKLQTYANELQGTTVTASKYPTLIFALLLLFILLIIYILNRK